MGFAWVKLHVFGFFSHKEIKIAPEIFIFFSYLMSNLPGYLCNSEIQNFLSRAVGVCSMVVSSIFQGCFKLLSEALRSYCMSRNFFIFYTTKCQNVLNSVLLWFEENVIQKNIRERKEKASAEVWLKLVQLLICWSNLWSSFWYVHLAFYLVST